MIFNYMSTPVITTRSGRCVKPPQRYEPEEVPIDDYDEGDYDDTDDDTDDSDDDISDEGSDDGSDLDDFIVDDDDEDL